MRFLLASLFRAAYRELIATRLLPLDTVPDLVDVRCPTCDALYVVDLTPDEEPWDLEAREWEALVRLKVDCPDHSHVLAVRDCVSA